MTRDESLALVRANCANENLVKHMIASEAVMIGLAERLGGVLQDDRGAQLSLQRIGQLREEVAEFERSRAAHPPGR